MEASKNRAEIDTSWPFQSVKEAVEVFGERFLDGNSHPGSDCNVKHGVLPTSSVMLDCLKKLEAALAETRNELVLLKEGQSQMEMAVSSLTVQFSNSLSVLSDLKKGKEADISVAIAEENGKVRSDRWDESRAEEWMASLEYLPSLSEALTIKMIEDDVGGRRGRVTRKKQKHGIPLVGGMFSKKKKTR